MRRYWKSVLSLLALLSVFCLSGTAVAGKGGKGGGNGGSGGDDGDTSGPPPAPVSYVLDTVLVEGRDSSVIDVNDDGELLFTVRTSEVTQTAVQTDATTSPAVVDINTGQVTYIDELLAESTPWSVLGEGVESARFVSSQINSHGDIIGNVVETVAGVEQLPEAFLLEKQIDDSEVITYQPTSLGVGNHVLLLNDVGQIVGGEVENGVRVFVRYADGFKLYLDELGLEGNISWTFGGLSNSGEFLFKATTYSELDVQVQTFILNVNTLELTSIDGFSGISGVETRSLNDYGVVSGMATVTYEEKRRGQIRTFSYLVPAILDPISGFQLFDNGNSFEDVTLNNQRFNGESAILASRQSGPDRQIWLNLPGFDPFYAQDALSADDQAVWSTFESRGGGAQLLTPRLADGNVDHEAVPMAAGLIKVRDANGVEQRPGFWVLRPAP